MTDIEYGIEGYEHGVWIYRHFMDDEGHRRLIDEWWQDTLGL